VRGKIPHKLLLIAFLSAGLGLAGPASSQGWPDVFEPSLLLTLHLQMDSGDWATVQNDDTLSIEVPAQFWADGEPPITIGVRRKSATPLNAGQGYSKVSLRLDINEFVPGQDWHGLKKLSLENGDDNNVINEGFGWHIFRMASGTQGFGYKAAYGNWVRLFINGVDTGVYVNPEMRDKRMLENRSLFVPGQTWLYEVEDVSGNLILHEGGPQDSPTVEALCYAPFAASPSCPAPDLATDVPQHVDMKGLLTLMAGDAFTVNGDATLTNGKNFYFADSSNGIKRMYFPWDLDAAPPGSPHSATSSIYGPRRTSEYALLLDVPEFRSQYSSIVNDLICGPWSTASLVGFLNTIEPILAGPVAADPNNQLGDPVAQHFDKMRTWVTNRVAHVTSELEGFQACPTVQLELNELMASNVATLEDPDETGQYPDWFEIYNPTQNAVDVGGVYVTDDPLLPTLYQIPNGVTIPAEGHLVLYADNDDLQGPLHTNFKLAAGGESLAIYDRDGATQLDSVSFGPQPSDVAYGRYPDGSGPWGFVPTATPGLPNLPHNLPPALNGTARSVGLPEASDVVTVTTTATDNGTVASVTLRYDAGGGYVPVAMFDDGAHGDGAAGDAVYGAAIPAFPDDTIVRYYLAATDDLGAGSVDPVPAPAVTYTYVVGYEPPPLAVNEYMASNATGITDPDEGIVAHEDWIEIYNAGALPVSLDGMYMTDDLTMPTKYALPPGLSVPAAGHLLLWADAEPTQGIDHLGFRLSAAGEAIGIFDTDARGNSPVDTLEFGLQTTDVSEGSCPDGFWAVQSLGIGSPGITNLSSPQCGGSDIVTFSGAAQGGQVQMTIDGRLIVVTTSPGDSVEDVARALAAAINVDPVLDSLGITANGLGPQLITSGTVDSLVITDPGISSPGAGSGPPLPVPSLGPAALLLLSGLLLATGHRAAGRGRAGGSPGPGARRA
jgi:hypothetical protein